MKTVAKLLAAVAAAAAVFSTAEPAHATNYSRYLHGLTALSGYTAPNGWQYWNGGATQPGINAVPVNYDGTVHISRSNATVRSYLDSYCTNGTSCYVAAHGMGAAQIGYAVANYPTRWSIPGWTSRARRQAAPSWPTRPIGCSEAGRTRMSPRSTRMGSRCPRSRSLTVIRRQTSLPRAALGKRLLLLVGTDTSFPVAGMYFSGEVWTQ